MIKLSRLLINGEDYIDYAVWTLQGQDTIDESLDMQYIELKATPFENPFKPFSDVLIELQDNKNTISKNMFIESDTVTEVILGVPTTNITALAKGDTLNVFHT